MDQVIAIRSRDEIESAILAFTPDEILRLRKVTWYYGRRYKTEAEDLFQEAVARALNGSRKCPVDVDVVKFLAEAIRSIAQGESEKIENQVTIVPIVHSAEPESGAVDPPDPALSIEENMLIEENAAVLYGSILSLFEEGSKARDMVEGIIDEWSAAELREVLDLDKTAYDSMRKFIRRKINKAYPKGWSHDRE